MSKSNTISKRAGYAFLDADWTHQAEDLRQGVTRQANLFGALITFCWLRLALSLVLCTAFWGFARHQFFGFYEPKIAAGVLVSYVIFSAGALVLARQQGILMQLQLLVHVIVDVAAIVLLMFASGGVRSGIGLLLLVTLAAAGLISRGRMVFFNAALAALAVLYEQTHQMLFYNALFSDFFQSGLLAGSYFAIAALGYTLAKYASGAEQIAQERGVDLANLAQINALVIRDMQDGFLVVDAQGNIVQHNSKCEALVGSISSELRPSLNDAVPQLAQFYKDWQQDRSQIFPVIRSNRTQKEIQVRFVAIGSVDLRVVDNPAIASGNVLPSPTVIFLEDAGRIRAQAQQLKLAALGRLTANIAHEIRNPLSSINHAAELLQEDVGRSHDDIRLLSIIRDNSFRLDRMVQEVLYLNRRDRAHPETIEPRACLELFLRDFCANEKTDATRFDLQITTTQNILFDRSHLDQVLWNLVRNASRYADDKHGAVRVIMRVNVNQSAEATQQSAELLVCDNGVGVAADTLSHLFEPFFTTDSQGTGLGLYVARELSEVNGATLDYLALPERDESLGEGGCFRLTVQIAT